MERISGLTRDETAEPVSRDKILRREQRQRNIHFPCSAYHKHDWQPYTVDSYSSTRDAHTHIHIYSSSILTVHFSLANVAFARRPPVAAWTYRSRAPRSNKWLTAPAHHGKTNLPSDCARGVLMPQSCGTMKTQILSWRAPRKAIEGRESGHRHRWRQRRWHWGEQEPKAIMNRLDQPPSRRERTSRGMGENFPSGDSRSSWARTRTSGCKAVSGGGSVVRGKGEV